MRAFLVVAAAALVVAASACAPKRVIVPAAIAPQFPEYVEPVVPAELATGIAAEGQARAWTLLQAGDLRSADREIASVLKRSPTFYPAEATAGYVELARNDAAAALTHFNRALDRRGDYAPALAGKGFALASAGRSAEAAEAFRAALHANPALSDLQRRIDVLTLKGLQDELATARTAARGGDAATALQAYRNAIAASPESAFLYREMAAVEREQGDTTAALQHLQQANRLDPTDPASFALVGDLLAQTGDDAGAGEAYEASLALEPSADVAAKRDALNARRELAALPAEYRAIASTPQVTRGEFAALIGVRLPTLLAAAPTRDVSVITDIRNHWAERWIQAVARAGVIEPFANHTFQPRAVIRRVEVAQAVSRLLALVRHMDPATARTWDAARRRFPDIGTDHLAYAAVSTAVASGVMETAPDGSFQPARPLSGAEAIALIDRIRALAGPSVERLSDRR